MPLAFTIRLPYNLSLQNAQRRVEVMIPHSEIDKKGSSPGVHEASSNPNRLHKGVLVCIGATAVSFTTNSPSSIKLWMQMSTIARTGLCGAMPVYISRK